MNLKESPQNINSLTVRHFTELLSENRKTVLKDTGILTEIAKLKTFLSKLDDNLLAKRSKSAAKKLSGMTEEERRLLLMSPGEKSFFLDYKKHHPDNPWNYFEAYQTSVRDEYQANGKN
jgi:hypothetical protein